MKKIIKILSGFLCLVMLTLSLGGCNKIDEMRKSQAFWKSRERNEILFEGKTYKKLPHNEYFNPNLSVDKNGKYKYSKNGRITESDVPVLLSDIFGGYFVLAANGEIMDCEGNYYAESGVFEGYSEMFNGFELSKLATDVIITDNKGHTFSALTPFTDEEAAAIEAAVQTASVSVKENPGEKYDYFDVLNVSKTDESTNFSNLFVSLYYYYDADEVFVFADGTEKLIPDEYKEPIKALFKKYGYSEPHTAAYE